MLRAQFRPSPGRPVCSLLDVGTRARARTSRAQASLGNARSKPARHPQSSSAFTIKPRRTCALRNSSSTRASIRRGAAQMRGRRARSSSRCLRRRRVMRRGSALATTINTSPSADAPTRHLGKLTLPGIYCGPTNRRQGAACGRGQALVARVPRSLRPSSANARQYLLPVLWSIGHLGGSRETEYVTSPDAWVYCRQKLFLTTH
ncbi:hypothetical protein B0H10DRAFT_508389 [Mycena sp. CBHHK59/15]|nr:hypothetical protein B0H10DRAFT_508389 [Mycena sp. CBHHK59/15]